MAALITARHNDKIVRCDANCYNARTIRSDQCTCICGGTNHGVGLRQGFENTIALEGFWKKNWRKAHKGEEVAFETIDQYPMFPDNPD
ncbi:hypothetical protein [Granulicella rosea]|uniref:hypothetical protein n=1 Tax=Granulicella rosea TaxID=474952 RepID=UPI00115D6029|nr:hypothetical protein [Granulicella rosea]